MKNRQTDHHLEINTSDIYCLRGNRTGMLLAGFVLTSILSPPPLQTSLLNITTHYEKKTLIVLVVLPLLCPYVHFGSLRVFVVKFGFA